MYRSKNTALHVLLCPRPLLHPKDLFLCNLSRRVFFHRTHHFLLRLLYDRKPSQALFCGNIARSALSWPYDTTDDRASLYQSF